MGPVRSLYKREGGLEKVLEQRPPGQSDLQSDLLRPVQMSDCGE